MNQNQDNLYNELVSKYEFNILQKEQIKLGLENNVNVSFYANLNLILCKWLKLG